MYLIDKPKSEIDKQQNKKIWEIAETIRAKRELGVLTQDHNIKTKKQKYEFFRLLLW